MASTVDLIKERLGIADVIGSYIELHKSGASYKAKCPFHNEKTPSFFVSPDRGGYYCFGCGVKGDIFTFVQEFEGVDFMGALKILAERAGVTITLENSRDRGERDKLYALMEAAVAFFEANLKREKEAHGYLTKRGLSSETIANWRLGFARDAWRDCLEYLEKKGFKRADIVKAGLVKEDQGKIYDRFRSRIMFPIFDSAGRPVAFSGRIFGKEDDKTPKYLNSPETPLFSKSRILFGFDRAKSEIRRLDYAILVEGQMDLLASHQGGYRNTVATSGTALTLEHLLLISRLSKRVMFVFDADRAGVGATVRGAALALSQGMDVKVAALPQGLDPAEIIVKDNALWRESLKSSKHIIDFYLDTVMASAKDERTLLREIRGKVLPFVKVLESGIDRDHYVKKVAEKAGVGEKAVAEDLEKTKPIFSDKELADGAVFHEDMKSPIETMAVGVLIWQNTLTKPDIEVKDFEEKLKGILGPDKYNLHIRGDNEQANELAFRAEFYYAGKGNLQEGLEELLQNLEEEFLKTRISAEMKKISEAEKKKDEKQLTKSLEISRDLSRRLDEIKNKRYFNNRL